jgi:hypothetical protein
MMITARDETNPTQKLTIFFAFVYSEMKMEMCQNERERGEFVLIEILDL